MFDNNENVSWVHENGRLAILKTDDFEDVRAVRGLKDPSDETGLKYLTGVYVTKVDVEGTPVFFYFQDINFPRTKQNNVWSVYPCDIVHGDVGRHSIRFRLEESSLNPTANKMELTGSGGVDFVKVKNLPPKLQKKNLTDSSDSEQEQEPVEVEVHRGNHNGCFRRPVTHAVSVHY